MTNTFDMKCPKCGDEDQIDINAAVWVRLTHDGTDADTSGSGDHEWSDTTAACCGACGHTATVGDFTPATVRTRKIAELNDLCRKAMGVAGRLVQTSGICALPSADQSAIREKVEAFDTFTPDNDPHGERDFGSFEHNGEQIFWKIDYYAPDMEHGSEDPADPTQTVRVLTILLASEY